MNDIIGAVRRHASLRPGSAAVLGDGTRLTYADLVHEIDALAARLQMSRLGLLLDNGAAWVVADLAALQGGVTCVPLPPFFSDTQLLHTLPDSGIEAVLTDRPARLEHVARVESVTGVTVGGTRLALCRLSARSGPGGGPAKISYTSGSTAAPRGVCLSRATIEQRTAALAQATAASSSDCSLCVTPLSTLLENIGGVYVPLLAGGACRVLPLEAVGLSGSSGLDPVRLSTTLYRNRPTSIITVPQILRALVEVGERGVALPDTLRFVAVGGATVSESVLHRAASLGLPVYQGYGLTEAASVVTLNVPGRNKVGSVGRPLPGVGLRIAADGEILIEGEVFDGYVGGAPAPGRALATGDIGFQDADGYVYVTGRKDNVYATAYGRNVSPEWVERELCAQRALVQAVVFGKGLPINIAVVVPMPGASPVEIDRALAAVNAGLPDYARVGDYLIAEEPFTLMNGTLTGNGRPRREAIARRYAAEIRARTQEAV